MPTPNGAIPASAGAGDSSLVGVDSNILGIVRFIPNNNYTVKFQFPPKIVQEGNKSEWELQDLWAIEPLKIHKGSQGRALTMEWEYVCTDSTWNGRTIAMICRNLRAYFFDFKRAIYPVAEIYYPPIIPLPINFRIMSADFTYSPEIIVQGSDIYPLHTKVSVGLELATRINSTTGDQKLQVQPLGLAVYEWY